MIELKPCYIILQNRFPATFAGVMFRKNSDSPIPYHNPHFPLVFVEFPLFFPIVFLSTKNQNHKYQDRNQYKPPVVLENIFVLCRLLNQTTFTNEKELRIVINGKNDIFLIIFFLFTSLTDESKKHSC